MTEPFSLLLLAVLALIVGSLAKGVLRLMSFAAMVALVIIIGASGGQNMLPAQIPFLSGLFGQDSTDQPGEPGRSQPFLGGQAEGTQSSDQAGAGQTGSDQGSTAQTGTGQPGQLSPSPGASPGVSPSPGARPGVSPSPGASPQPGSARPANRRPVNGLW